MKKLLVLVGLLSMSVYSASNSQETQVKETKFEDEFKFIKKIENKRHSLKGKFRGKVAYNRFYADKFARVDGISIGAGYFFRDEWEVDMGLTMTNSELITETDEMRNFGFTPTVFAQESILSLNIFYRPVYGKFQLFEKTYHFSVGGLLGLERVVEKSLTTNGDFTEGDTVERTGIKIGGSFLVPINETLDFEVLSHFSRYENPDSSQGDQKVSWSLLYQIGARF